MIGSLLTRAGLTLEAAATLCGVSSRTIMNWRDGKTRIPAEALHILEFAAADAELESAAEPMTLAERIATFRGIQQMQSEQAARIEDDLAEARRELAETTSRLNALLAERGRLEKS